MSKNLVIVESPAKAKTINKYLGKNYVVKASMGHVRDLPKSKLGIDVDNDFEPKYTVIKDRGDVVKELKKFAKTAERVYLAPDPDREGEAIAWHLKEALELPDEKVYRVTFNEITKKAITEGIATVDAAPDHRIRQSLVDAQQTRRILDRLVGYKLSPLLWDKIARGLSAGRVQSVAVRLIVEREKEIRAFVIEEYWRVVAKLGKDGKAQGHVFDAELKRRDGKAFEPKNGDEAQAVLDEVTGKPFVVTTVEKKAKSVKASPPLSTSLLQQQASTRLRFTASRTMRVAQQLYEGIDVGGEEGQVGLITYMRTDSYRLAGEAITAARDYIGEHFGKEYLPAKPNVFAARKGAQEAHEAIRPTDITRTPDSIKDKLSAEQYRLYKLIWERVVACQMANAVYDQTSATIDCGRYQFAARGRALRFDGHLRVTGAEKASAEQDLPAIDQGETLAVSALEKHQHFTEPPARYSEATLVKALEKNGIGRPSTYAAIISTIQARGYVKLTERKFHATELGEVVNQALVEHFPKFVDYQFTAGMELKLDDIEAAKAEWLDIVRDFYSDFVVQIEKAQGAMPSLKTMQAPTGQTCPKCGKEMIERFSRFGRFYGCSGYPECRYIVKPGRDGQADEERPEPEKTDEICGKCGSPMVIRSGRRGKFMACSAYPKCKNTFSVDAEGKPIKPIETDFACEKCGKPMIVRGSKRGPFLGCTGYPKCRGTKQLPKDLPDELQAKIKAMQAARRKPAGDADEAAEGDGDAAEPAAAEESDES
jgi:DNA topoisomerase-1